MTLGRSAYRKSNNKQAYTFIRQNQILEIESTEGDADEDSDIYGLQAMSTEKKSRNF
jgi:hypothetical protein